MDIRKSAAANTAAANRRATAAVAAKPAVQVKINAAAKPAVQVKINAAAKPAVQVKINAAATSAASNKVHAARVLMITRLVVMKTRWRVVEARLGVSVNVLVHSMQLDVYQHHQMNNLIPQLAYSASYSAR